MGETTKELRQQAFTVLLRIEKVGRRMREQQRAFFRGDRSRERVAASQREERLFDQALKELDDLRERIRQPALPIPGDDDA